MRRTIVARAFLTLALISFLSGGPLPDRVQAAAGDLDPTFGDGGKVITPFSDSFDFAEALVLQPDSKIIVAGAFGFDSSEGRFALARYNPDGSLDSSFGFAGRVTTDFSLGDEIILDILLQPDGRIVAAGVVSPITLTNNNFALARYHPDGSLDFSFGSGGKVVTDFRGGHDRILAIALQNDEKILVAGIANTPDNGQGDFALARYNPDGSLDTSFGSGGKVTTEFSGGSGIEAMTLQPDGKILVAGIAFGPPFDPMLISDFALARYNPDGSLDLTFGDGGKITTDFFGFSDGASAIALQKDGRIVAAGTATLNPFSVITFGDFALARYNPDGSLDSSFGTGGKTITDFSGTGDNAHDILLQPDGKIVAAGIALNSTVFDGAFALARYNVNGSLDVEFGSDGKVVTDFPGSQDRISSITLQPDNKIVAAGRANITATRSGFALARYEGDSFDTCLQDESNGNILQINTTTGSYQFINCIDFTIGGIGIVTKRGSIITLQHNGGDRRVSVKIDTAVNKGTASIQVFSQGSSKFSIADRNITDNTCACNPTL